MNIVKFKINTEVQDLDQAFSTDMIEELRAEPDQVFQGDPVGICGVPFAGDQMINISYPEGMAGFLVPSRFVVPAFDYPRRTQAGNVRAFLVLFEKAVDFESSDCDLGEALIASADTFAEAMHHCYAHRDSLRAATASADPSAVYSYQIVKHATMKTITKCLVYLNDVKNERSWAWDK